MSGSIVVDEDKIGLLRLIMEGRVELALLIVVGGETQTALLRHVLVQPRVSVVLAHVCQLVLNVRLSNDHACLSAVACVSSPNVTVDAVRIRVSLESFFFLVNHVDDIATAILR